MAKIRCTARGSEDVSKIVDKLDDTLVQFLLIKFPVGSGTFKRNKFIYVHFVGPKASIVKRGKWNAELPTALKLFGATSAGLEIGAREQMSFESLVTKLQKVFVADDGSFSVSKIQEEYNRRLKEEEAMMVKQVTSTILLQSPGSPKRNRKLAVALGFNAENTLRAIREDLGPINWCTFMLPAKAPELVEGGSNGIFELIENLPDDKVLFGVMRLAFGTGRFRRSKQVFFQWTGDAVGAIQKGKANAAYDEMLRALGPVNMDIKLSGEADLKVSAILEKVQKVFVVDNINLPAEEKKKKLTEEEYLQALAEEQKATSSFYNEPEIVVAEVSGPPPPPADFDVTETIDLIHRDAGGLTWGLFQVA